MMSARVRRMISLAALAAGVVIFAVTLTYFDVSLALASGRRLALAVLLAILASGLTHLTRTWAWRWCFIRPGEVPYLPLLRIRLAAEAFSYLTISGLAGDPLKVVLLGGRVSGREAAAAVALERISYIVGTTIVVGAAAVVALATQPLSPVAATVFRAFAIGSGVLAAAIALIVIRRDSYLLAAFRAADRKVGTHIASGSAGRFVADVGRQIGALVGGDGRRLVVLTISTLIVYGCMAAEVWLILRAVGVPVAFTSALAAETLSRVASFASTFVPANLGTLEASSIAAATAVGAGTCLLYTSPSPRD